ncbi:hypothetical protein [Candidatus Lokiarchaeum ossiferum]|uniref:hypothetical protein n=1 Tax=Candidatus Lokiarchaeum ossiferum TaxID=2951803 RepID=UPI00352F169E
MAEIRYCQCKKCGKPFTNSGKAKAIRHSNCGGYALEITKEQFDSLKVEKTEKDPDQKQSGVSKIENSPLVSLELDTVFDEVPENELELGTENQPIQLVQPIQDSLLGSTIVWVENIIFGFTGKETLNESEKNHIKTTAVQVSQKYPILANMKGGNEIELAEATSSPFLRRLGTGKKKKEKKENENLIKQTFDNSRKDGKRQDVFAPQSSN